MDDLVQADAIEAFLKQLFPSVGVHLFHLPEKPYSGMVAVLNPISEERRVNQIHTEIVSTWRILYYHEHPAQTVKGMNAIRSAFIKNPTIPFKDEAGKMYYLRVRAFSSSEMGESESEVHYILGTLETSAKGVMSVEQEERMEEIVFEQPFPVIDDYTFN